MSSDWTEREAASLEELFSASKVATIDEARALSAAVEVVYAQYLDDAMVEAIVEAAPRLRRIVTSGNNLVTDDGVRALVGLRGLVELDLEWSAVTDDSIRFLAEMPSLKLIDLSFSGVSQEGIDALRALRPDLEIAW